jgi:filamentous hemagglutinin
MPRPPAREVITVGFLPAFSCAVCLLFVATRAVAGDLLRGGSSSSSSAPVAGSSGGSPSAAKPVNLNAADILRRSTAALQAVQSMQAAAQASAAAANAAHNLGSNPRNPGVPLPNVTDGLSAPNSTGPGLSVAYANGAPTLWVGASAPTQQTSTGANGSASTTVTVDQQQQQAYLQWQTFDIGKNTSLVFDQSAGGSTVSNWIAFNYVRDPSGRPSQILGSISAIGPTNSQGAAGTGGQVYVIDANGIIFGGSSQVNAGALVASSLPINSGLIQRGLLNNPDEQFLFSALTLAQGPNGPTPAFNPASATAGIAPQQTPYDPDGSGATSVQYSYGDVTVQAGAQLTAPSTNFVGGKVALVGPNVTNAGTIETPDGQTILAAGLQVGWAAHNSSDASLRGLDVYVGAVSEPNISNAPLAGTATNADVGTTLSPGQSSPAAGLIEAPRGDVTIAGAAVNQLGVIDSSTSVSYNGRVDLLASYNSVSSGGLSSVPFFPLTTGPVTLGSDSLTQILPQVDDPTTLASTSLPLASTVVIQGSSISLQGNGVSGAILLAPSGNVTADAGSWQFTTGGVTAGGISPSSVQSFVFNGGTIALENNSAIDVSGSENVSASVQEDIVAVQLLGAQLADSPVQRNGPLRGPTIDVNILDTGIYNGQPWVGTPLADTTGYVSLIPHTVGELTANGGNVTLQAGAAVNIAPGSTVNVAGGWIAYAGSLVQTTELLYQGQVVNIAQATPNLVYQGIYTGTSSTTDSKWNATTSSTNPLPLETYMPGYIQGGNGGALAITAGAMTLGGTLFGQTYAGQNQRNVFLPYTSSVLQNEVNANIDPRVWELDSMPASSSLTLSFEEQFTVQPGLNLLYSPAPPDIFFQPANYTQPSNPNALVLSPNLTDPGATTYGGFGNLTINDSIGNEQVDSSNRLVEPAVPSTQTITIPAGVTLQTVPGGSVTLNAANIVLDGAIVSPGGSVSLTANEFSSSSAYIASGGAGTFGPPAYNPLRGILDVGSAGVVNTNGLIVDDRTASGLSSPLITSGGSVSLSGSNVTMDSGAIISANGGAHIGATGSVTYGNGGSIALEAGQNPNSSAVEILGGTLAFDIDDQLSLPSALVPLQAYSGGTGGTLTLESSIIQVGSSPEITPPAGTLLLPSADAAGGGFQSFFNTGGFAGFTLIGLGDIIDPANGGTPVLNSKGGVSSSTAVFIASGTAADPTLIHPRVEQMEIIADPAGGFATQTLAPFSYQNTPTNLTFSAPGVLDSSEGRTGISSLVVRGDVVADGGATIETDPQTNGSAGVSMTGQTVTVLGTVIAPGGTISVKGSSDSTTIFPGAVQGLPTVDLGPDSELSTAGLTLLTQDYLGRVPGEVGYVNSGSVLPGGSVNVSGNIVTESDPSNPSAIIDVSGWSDANDPWGLLEMAPQYGGGASNPGVQVLKNLVVPTLVATNGGTITFHTGEALFPDKPMMGAAGGPSAVGGTLTVSGQAGIPGVIPVFETLLVTANGPTIPGSFYPTGETAIGHAVLGANGAPLSGLNLANFSAGSFAAGDFDSLNLYGAIDFQGPAPIDIAAKGGLTIGGSNSTFPGSGYVSANTAVMLSAAEVTIGQAYLPPLLPADEPPLFSEAQTFLPTPGSGTLSIVAGRSGSPGLINVGNLTLQNISTASFTSFAGDVQGYGTVDIAGNLTVASDLVYPSTAETFSINAYNFTPVNGTLQQGSVTFEPSPAAATRPVPLTAEGTLDVYASVIVQNGVLRAPLGTINLGWDGTGAAPATDPITGGPVPSTQALTLGGGSITSVSGNSAGVAAGSGLPIPYGVVLNGTSWINPIGTDITSSGPAPKAIDLQGTNVKVASGATVDTSGGGDLYAYQFIPGTGGENDILSASSGSFAVIPGYATGYSPNASFNPNQIGTSSQATNLLFPDLGYSSSTLVLGEQIRIDLGAGAGVQTYTLMPARYALLPGAYLITPISTSSIPPAQPTVQTDGSYVASGYMFNAFDPSQPLYSEFNVASGTPAAGSATTASTTVVRSRAQYSDFLANTFFNPASSSSTSPESGMLPVPLDGGQLTITAGDSLVLQGSVDAQAATGGEGGGVDISSSGTEGIVINDTGVAPTSNGTADTLYLSAAEISNFGAGSIIIGGTLAGSTVTVTAPSVEVANDSSAALKGSDITLVANQSLAVDAGAVVQATGVASSPAPSLQIADAVQLEPASSVLAATSTSELSLSRGGTPVNFTKGIPTGDTLIASAAGTVTSTSGVVTIFAKGASFNSASTVLVEGSTLSFTSPAGGSLILTGTGAPVSLLVGDGTLLRVSDSATAVTTRIPVVSSTAPDLSIGSGATLSGASVVADSTNVTNVASSALLIGGVSLSGGQISLVLDPMLASDAAGANPSSLILSGATLAGLQTNATSLSLLSYSSIDTYGSGTIGSANYSSLGLHAAEIRGFDAGSGANALGATTSNTSVVFEAKAITLDNSPGGAGPGPVSGNIGTGSLAFDATSAAMTLGVNALDIDQFGTVFLTAAGGVLVQGTAASPGSLNVSGNLKISAPAVAGTAGAVQTIEANNGALTIEPLPAAVSLIASGLGADLTLIGSSVVLDGQISMPSGTLNVAATGATLDTGSVAISGDLDVAGTAQTFNNTTSYTDGGKISIGSTNGNVALEPGAYVGVGAASGGGDAGSLSISAPAGSFTVAATTASNGGLVVPTLNASAPEGQAGTFSLDVANLSDANGNATPSLGPLEEVLSGGNFSLSQVIRIRTGNVTIDGTVVARTLDLSADDPSKTAGNIEVTGNGYINASGPTGGTVELDASGGVTLDSGSQISVEGVNFNDAGQGGSVTLQAGSYVGQGTKIPTDLRNVMTGLFTSGVAVNVAAGSTINLSVVNDRAIELNPGGASASTAPGAISLPAGLGVYFPAGTPGDDKITTTEGGTITLANGSTEALAASSTVQLPAGSTVTLSSAGSIAFASGSGGSIPVNVPINLPGGAALNLSSVNITDLSAFKATGTLELEAQQVFDASTPNPFDSTAASPVDVRIDPIAGNIIGASSVVAVGFELFNLTPTPSHGTSAATAAVIDSTVQGLVQQNGALFAGGYTLDQNGNTVAVAGHSAAISSLLAGGNSTLSAILHVRPGAEIVNTAGALDLDSTWDFTQTASYTSTVNPQLTSTVMLDRFGPNNSEPGVLLLRAAGNIALGQVADLNSGGTDFGSLSDGFTGYDGADNSTLIDATLLPSGSLSWSFRLVAGADFTAADSTRVLPQATLAAAGGTGAGSILLGQGASSFSTFETNDPADYYQTIRTGTGSIGLYAGLNVELLDNLFSVYTAGTQTDPLLGFSANVDDTTLPQFSSGGGNVTVEAQGSIEHLTATGQPDSSKELPVNWLDRQGSLNGATGQFTSTESTAWWVDFTNFYEGVGALGGGNVDLQAGGNISNVDAVVPTSEQTTLQTTPATTGGSTVDVLAADQSTLELGGGDLSVRAGQNINGGVYYVERGQGFLNAGGSIVTNSTRAALTPGLISANPAISTNPESWLPTTLFLGDGNFTVKGGGDVLLGGIVNPFLLPAPSGSAAYFSTYAADDSLSVTSLIGSLTLKDSPDDDLGSGSAAGSVLDWLGQISAAGSVVKTLGSSLQPWLALNVPQISAFSTFTGIMPSSVYATAFSGDINLVGGITLLPSAYGQLALNAAGSINGFQPNSASISFSAAPSQWGSAVINLSDANPTSIPALTDPLSLASTVAFANVDNLFAESGSLTGNYAVLQTQEALHTPGILHADDTHPLIIDASKGTISGLTLYSAKSANVSAGTDITDVSLYVQNDNPGDITTVTAGGDIVPYDPTSSLRTEVTTSKQLFLNGGSQAGPASGSPTAGDIQIAGPGTLEVLAGGNINLGETVGPSPTNGTSVGVTSIGNSADPYLSFQGADVVMASGIQGIGAAAGAAPGLANTNIDFSNFIAEYINPATAAANAARYLPELAEMLGVAIPTGSSAPDIWTSLQALPHSSSAELDDNLALDVFYLVLRDAGRDHNDAASQNFGTYAGGDAAITALFPGSPTSGADSASPSSDSITSATRLVESTNGGDIALLAPAGYVTVGRSSDPQKVGQGVLTESGGNISIYAQNDIGVGTSRIFTLKGGNEIIWSTLGGIAAGSGSKTVHSAPPSRVLVDPQSATVEADLAGLATGSGIGVLATLSTVSAGDVDLIAPVGTIDAGDAGIRASGNVSVAALHVLNATNIQAGGATTGVPVVAPPNIGNLTSASSTSAATASSASEVATRQQTATQTQETDIPSVIDVEVVGYGGGEDFPS